MGTRVEFDSYARLLRFTCDMCEFKEDLDPHGIIANNDPSDYSGINNLDLRKAINSAAEVIIKLHDMSCPSKDFKPIEEALT